YMRFFTSGAAVLDGDGTEDLSGVDGGNLVAHWLLNDTIGSTAVNDDNPGTLDGSIIDSADGLINVNIVTADGKVGTASFDLDGQYCVSVGDAAGLSFTDDTDDEPFSIACWANVTNAGVQQVLLSKWQDESTAAEYRLRLDENRKLQLHLSDTSTNLASDRVAQWKLNETAANTEVHDDVAVGVYPDPHDGISTANAATLTATGKTNMTPCFDFDGQYAVEVADAAALSFGDATNDSPFSISAWVFVTYTDNIQRILTKWDSTTASPKYEWMLYLDSSEKLGLFLIDIATGDGKRLSDVSLTTGWHFVAATYDGSGGAAAGSGITLYVDGTVEASTATGFVSYVAMHNTTTKVVIGSSTEFDGNLGNYFADKIDNVTLFDIELTSANVSSLYNSGEGTEVLSGDKISSISDSSLELDWHFLVCTYDAVDNGSATAADGIILYVDGVAVASTASNNANYTAMQDGAEELRIGAQRGTGDAANEKFWADKIDEVSLFKAVLTPTQIASLFTSASYEIETPY
ncbi:hypothetical protein LCGC14_2441470, partial [marine sediment metagenome]